MKIFKRKLYMYGRYAVLIISVYILLCSCASSRIISERYTNKKRVYKPAEGFYLKPITITAFNFFDDEEIGYIMNKKLDFALKNIEGLTLNNSVEKSVYAVEPELVIKTFEEKYRMKSYYMLNVRVLQDGQTVLQYTYEYNGTASIFDGRIQNALIGKFIRDLKKYIK